MSEIYDLAGNHKEELIMAHRPVAVAFDVIETLFSLESLRPRLQALGLKADALDLWFAQMLRDAFALAATNTYKPFKDVAAGSLEVMLVNHGLRSDASRIETVLQGFAELSTHPDVAIAFARIHDVGIRIVTLTNGSAKNTRALLEKAGLAGIVEQVLSIEEVKAWKPRRQVYLHAAEALALKPEEMALVAAHAWDCHGAKQAGLLAGWVERQDKRFQPAFQPPDVTGNTVLQVCERLLALPAK